MLGIFSEFDGLLMGRTKGSYNPEFPVGTKVRVVNSGELELFSKRWTYHHPLESEQLRFGGYEANVVSVSFYHGGDELYELSGVPGVWHEECLQTITET